MLKTQTITISDVTNSLRGTVTYRDVPLVHTETKTITYESAQVRQILGIAHRKEHNLQTFLNNYRLKKIKDMTFWDSQKQVLNLLSLGLTLC